MQLFKILAIRAVSDINRSTSPRVLNPIKHSCSYTKQYIKHSLISHKTLLLMFQILLKTMSKAQYNFVKIPRKLRYAFNPYSRIFISANINNVKLCSANVIYISTDEDPSLRIETFAVVNLRGVSTYDEPMMNQ